MKSNIIIIINLTMYIACPKCQTKFIVTNNQIGINGRRVKCSKCNHIWYQKLDYKTGKLSDFNEDKVSFETVKTPVRNEYSDQFSVNIPVILPYIPSKQKYNIFPILWASFIILCLAILLIDSFSLLSRYDQLKIEEINLRKSANAGSIKLFYKLSNQSNSLISNPFVKVKVINNDNQVLEEYVAITKLKVKILAKQNVYVEMDVKGLPITAKYIDFAIGNRLVFLLE